MVGVSYADYGPDAEFARFPATPERWTRAVLLPQSPTGAGPLFSMTKSTLLWTRRDAEKAAVADLKAQLAQVFKDASDVVAALVKAAGGEITIPVEEVLVGTLTTRMSVDGKMVTYKFVPAPAPEPKPAEAK